MDRLNGIGNSFIHLFPFPFQLVDPVIVQPIQKAVDKGKGGSTDDGPEDPTRQKRDQFTLKKGRTWTQGIGESQIPTFGRRSRFRRIGPNNDRWCWTVNVCSLLIAAFFFPDEKKMSD